MRPMQRTATTSLLLSLAIAMGGCPAFTSSEETTEPADEVVTLESKRPAEPASEPAGGDGHEGHGHAQPRPGGDEAPQTVSARHILVQYEGSARAGADITRSKEEARSRAEEVESKAKGSGADFAALAREYSDGPTGKRGGDLGAFPKGRMHPAFEDAVFDLGVGEVSGVVETPFGFHVIKRYR